LADFVFPGDKPKPIDVVDVVEDPEPAPVIPFQLPNDLLYNLDPFDTLIFDATNRLRTDP
jgi:hypothetical protein